MIHTRTHKLYKKKKNQKTLNKRQKQQQQQNRKSKFNNVWLPLSHRCICNPIKVFCGCILFGKGPDKNNTEGLRSALARLRNRTGPSIPTTPQPTPPASPLPTNQATRIRYSTTSTSTTTASTASTPVVNNNRNPGLPTTTTTTATTTNTTLTNSPGTNNRFNGQTQNCEHYVPGSPIFRETSPITIAPSAAATSSSPKSRGKVMTVSVTHATQGASVVVNAKSATAAAGTPSGYTSTRSAAMMALAMGHQQQGAAADVGRQTTAIKQPQQQQQQQHGNYSKQQATTNTSNATTTSIFNETTITSTTTTTTNTTISTTKKIPPTMLPTTPPQTTASKTTAAKTTISSNMAAAVVSPPPATRQFTQVNGTHSGGSGNSSGSDNDGFNTSSSSTATALRRFYFKSGRSAKNKVNASVTTPLNNIIPLSAVSNAYHTSMSGSGVGIVTSNSGNTGSNTAHAVAGVPKVVIMGTSSASLTDANINTSTDSASTLITNVTHTDTSETCDSLDLGDNSCPSEPLFSSLEEPLLTAIQVDSEHDVAGIGTELELTSCSRYNRPDMNLQDSTESQESCLSILTGEPSSTTPLLSSHRRITTNNNSSNSNNNARSGSGMSVTATSAVKERLPNTAPPPTSSTKQHFTFDPPKSPKSARTSEKTRSHFTFKDSQAGTSNQQRQQQQQQQQHYQYHQQQQQQYGRHDAELEAMARTGSRSKYRAYATQRNSNYYANEAEEPPTSEADEEEAEGVIMEKQRTLAMRSSSGSGSSSNNSTSKKLRSREPSANPNARHRYSTGGAVVNVAATLANASNRISPKRERKRSPSSSSSSATGATSKVNSAPPTMKDGNFFASSSMLLTQRQLSPAAQQQQRKYSSSSSSGGSERERCNKDGTMFPFDREALDYERIQRECFAVQENSSSATVSSDSDEAEHCSVYERKLTAVQHGSPKSTDIFQQYSLLTQQEQLQQQQQQQHHYDAGGRPLSRKNSKRIRPDSVIHTTIRENQQYVPHSDAFYPSTTQRKSSSSPSDHSYVELKKFDDIATKFEQIPPKHGSSANLHMLAAANSPGSNSCNKTLAHAASPTGSLRGGATSPLPDLRVDFFAEAQIHQPRKRSFKSKQNVAAASKHDMLLDEGQNQQRQQQQQQYNANCAVGVFSGGGCGSGSGNNSNSGSVGGSINVTPNPMLEAAVCTQPRATIVVQQPSLSLDNTVETLLIKNEGDFISVEQGKEFGARKRHSQQLQHPPHHTQQQQQQQKRDDNMRQLLDVTNTLTFEELRDFEMRYGSPHHSRSQSVKTPGSRASGRPNQLCLPQQRSRVASMPNTGVEEEYYRLRHFSITGKGVVNRGDSLKSRRSRSNNSVASSNSSTEHLTATQIPAPNSARTSATCSLASSRESSTSNPGSGPYRVLMLGGSAVGKSSIVSQFMTSEYLHAYDTSIDDDSGEKSVSVLLSGEESELIFIDHAYTEMAPDDCLGSYDPHGYCVIYSASDRSSFNVAEHVLQVLWTNQNIAQKAVILVANKADLARSRLVTTDEGKAMATAYDCKFIETSVGINHNVDELLVGLLSQIRLKLENPEKSRDLFRKRSIRKSKRRACSPLSAAGCLNPNTPLGPTNNAIADNNTPPGSAQSSPRKYRGSRTSTSLKVKGLLGRVWQRDSKSKSCENLHVL